MNTRNFLPATLVLASTLALPMVVHAHAYQSKVSTPPASERRAEREEDIEVVLRTAASLQKTAQAQQSITNSRAANSYAQADRLFTMLFQVAQRDDLKRNNTIAAGTISARDANTGVSTLQNAAKDPAFRAESSTLRQIATLFASGTRAFLAGESQAAFGTAADEEQWLDNRLDNSGNVPAQPEVLVPPTVVAPYDDPRAVQVTPTAQVVPTYGSNIVTVSPFGTSINTPGFNSGFYSPYEPLYGNGLWNNGFVLNTNSWNNNGGFVSSGWNNNFGYTNPTIEINDGYFFPNWGNPYVQVVR
jgi:hypothetical protein